MKKIIVIAAGMLALAGASVAYAPTSSASVCQPNGTRCTRAGTYPGPNTVISSDYTGFKVVWTESVVRPYSSGVPLYWTAYMTYTNVASTSLTLGCPGNWADASYVSEHMSGGSGDDGTVSAESTICSQNPGLAVPLPPGGSYTLWATFHNVPWPGSAVAITWGGAGTSPKAYPFQSKPSASPPSTPIVQDIWAGYSASPVTGWVDDAEAEWTIPAVTCPANGHPRAAVWVGIWGSTASIHDHATWLPQIGTDSQCTNGKASYLAVWEMFTNSSSPLCPLLSQSIFAQLLCAGTPVTPITGLAVSPGNKINAAVAFLGPTTTQPAKRNFELRMTNLATGKFTQFDVTTDKAVSLDDIVHQGGAIAEDEDPCPVTLTDPATWINLLTCAHPANGLAKFSDAIRFSHVYVLGGSGGDQYLQWDMKMPDGTPLAMTEPLSVIYSSSSESEFQYSIGWKQQN